MFFYQRQTQWFSKCFFSETWCKLKCILSLVWLIFGENWTFKNFSNSNFLCIFSEYKLVAFISHMGTSTMVGHYVCHILKDKRWVIYNDEKVALSEHPPTDLAYMYLYQRVWTWTGVSVAVELILSSGSTKLQVIYHLTLSQMKCLQFRVNCDKFFIKGHNFIPVTVWRSKKVKICFMKGRKHNEKERMLFPSIFSFSLDAF